MRNVYLTVGLICGNFMLAIVSSVMTARKGLHARIWFAWGMIFGPFTLFLAVLSKRRPYARNERSFYGDVVNDFRDFMKSARRDCAARKLMWIVPAAAMVSSAAMELTVVDSTFSIAGDAAQILRAVTFWWCVLLFEYVWRHSRPDRINLPWAPL